MVRYHEDEINHRRKLRKKYLEDPNFRRWSDIAPDSDEIDAFFSLSNSRTQKWNLLSGTKTKQNH